MITTKKGVVEHLLFSLLALFIAALILFYGYKAISSLQQRAEEIALIRFEKSLQAKIETLTSQYDSMRIEEFTLPRGIDRVCFADLSQDISERTPDRSGAGLCDMGNQNYNALACNAITDKTDSVFLLPTFQNLHIKRIKITQGTLCVSSRGGLLTLRLTGKGDGTFVEETSTIP